jgi:GNAT superfamily N-acetyltransferase
MIKEITNEEEKQKICSNILRELPDWFGTESGLKEYEDGVIDKKFFAYYDNETPIGFYALKYINDSVCNLYVLGIKKEYHRNGIGSKFQEYVENYAKNKNFKYLTVYTLSDDSDDEYYEKTRKFYLKHGFIPLYKTNAIWGEDNPFLLLMKVL